MGKKTGAWSTTITYDPADINDANLKQYDAIFLASTTGAFLDDPNDAAATAARRKALLDFVRGGKGLAGIHAATDSYHQNARRRRGGGGGGRGGGARRGRTRRTGAPSRSSMAQGDKNADQKLIARGVRRALADAWYDKLDADQGRPHRAGGLPAAVRARLPPPAPPRRPAAAMARRRRPTSARTRRSAPGPSSTR